MWDAGNPWFKFRSITNGNNVGTLWIFFNQQIQTYYLLQNWEENISCTATSSASFFNPDSSGDFESFFQFLPALYTLCVSHGKTEEAGLPACGWHMRSFLKCHWAWCTDDSRLLLAFTTFCNRCSRWTSAPVFLKCTQIKRYHVLDVKSFLLPWIIFCVHDSATGN